MKPKMTITGVADVQAMLRNVASKVSGSSRKVMDRAADRVVENAKAMTPVDQGYLEESIVRDTDYEVENRRRKMVFISVGGMTAPDGTNVSDYALDVHENYDETNMGPNSRLKQAGQTLKIGRHFLTRALEMEQQRLPDEIATTVRANTRG